MKALTFAAILLLSLSRAFALDVQQPDVQAFIDEMVREHDFTRSELEDTLAEAERKQAILDAISRPAEKTLTWGEYRRIFLTPERIDAGRAFWAEHAEMLSATAATSGVPEHIIVAIIGVETYFGRITGGYRVLDALTTLAFHYPPRAAFFRRELEAYLLLVREEGLVASEPTGSYAGAMGRPQFMPSSYRAYAYDATGDGRRDIWNDWADVAGSIANYMNEHGWRSGDTAAVRATLGDAWQGPPPRPRNTLEASATVRSLLEAGVVFATDLPGSSKAELLSYEAIDGPEYRVGFHNFFVITRYNRSVMYALAVLELGDAIALAVAADAN